MFEVDEQARPYGASAGVDPHLCGPLDQAWVEQQLDATVAEALVGLEVLASEVGVDRHLGDAASTDRWNEIDRCGAALSTHPFHCCLGHLNLHARSNRSEALFLPDRCWGES